MTKREYVTAIEHDSLKCCPLDHSHVGEWLRGHCAQPMKELKESPPWGERWEVKTDITVWILQDLGGPHRQSLFCIVNVEK